jgi:hypothetical protein
MKLSIQDALAILNITQNPITPDAITAAYRKAVSTYHPDRNPSGTEMMKLINQAYDVLKNLSDVSTLEAKDQAYGEAINAALNTIHSLVGLEVEICGAWVWVMGNTKAHKEILKAAGFRWGKVKQRWYFRPAEWKSKNRKPWSMDQIRDTYGSASYHPQDESKKLSAAA